MTTDPLVSTEWLAAHMGDANVKILDASFKLPGVLPLPKDDYLAALDVDERIERGWKRPVAQRGDLDAADVSRRCHCIP